MAYSLKNLAQACLQAEAVHAKFEIAIEPRFILRLQGIQNDEIVHVLTGFEGRDLTGQFLSYIPDIDKTLVLITSANVRKFFNQMGTMPEKFVSEKWIADAYQKKQSSILCVEMTKTKQ